VDDVPSQISNTRVLRDYCDDTSWSWKDVFSSGRIRGIMALCC
jgi:hypothetical protein